MPAEVKQVSVAAPAGLFSVSHPYLQPFWLLVTGSSVCEICAVPFIFLDMNITLYFLWLLLHET